MLLFRVRSHKAGAFKASNTDLVKLDNPSLTLDDPSSIESATRYTRSKYHAGSNSVCMRNMHYITLYFSCSVRVALLF